MPLDPNNSAQLYADLKVAMRDVVRDYGAKANGVADDTAAINQAIADCGAASGGIVFFPAGTYLVSSDLVVAGSNILLLGTGRGSTIRAAANSLANCIKITGAHITVADLQIDGNKTNVQQIAIQYKMLNGIFIYLADDVTVRNCYIHDCYVSGIMGMASNNLNLYGNRLVNCFDNQIYVRADNQSPFTPSNYITITGNVCNNGSFSGIQVLGSNYIAITGNVCYANGPTQAQGDGIGSEGSNYVTIAGNECHSNGIQGIQTRFTSELAVNTKSTHITLVGNVVYNHPSTNGDAGGIGINDTDDVLVADNLCYSNNWGINVNGGQGLGVTNCMLAGNVCRGSASYGIRIAPPNADTFLIVDCYSADNGSDNLNATARVWVMGGVYARAASSHEGINLGAGAGGSIIQGAAIFDNPDNGILVGGGIANCEIRNCTFDQVSGVQNRALFETSGSGPTRLVANRIRNQNFQDFVFNNASSVARGNDDLTNGYRDEASGTATITMSGTTVTVTHNLYTTPMRIELTPTADPQSGIRYWISARTSTTFTITASSAPSGSAVSFDWRAWAYEA